MAARGAHLGQTGDRGAALIEFAILMPLLVLLVLGVVEFGWAFGQYNDVRHGARQAARLAAANTDSADNMRALVCSAMDLSSGPTVRFTDGATGSRGEQASVTVIAPLSTLSGLPLWEAIIPDTLTSAVDLRLEQDSDLWASDISPPPCP